MNTKELNEILNSYTNDEYQFFLSISEKYVENNGYSRKNAKLFTAIQLKEILKECENGKKRNN